jgi:hypothetical protein
MAGDFGEQIKSELCPNGIWQLSDRMKTILKRQINRLPKENVTEEETMYPDTVSGMRAFLEVFFSRHYFQVQNSLLDYVNSGDFEGVLNDGEIRILDIGCGPAVGVLAVTDMITCILENRNNLRQHPIRFVYVLNDTSEICLAIGQRMLNEYFDLCRAEGIGISEHRILTIDRDFPDNAGQLERIAKNYGAYHLEMFSYVIRPLADENGINGLAKDIINTEKLCEPRGRILILQDQYRETLMRALGNQIDVSVENKELTQEIFPDRGTEDTHTYSYYQCLYKPSYSSAEAVAGGTKGAAFEGI